MTTSPSELRLSWPNIAAAFVGALLSLLAAPLVTATWAYWMASYDLNNPPARAALESYELRGREALRLRFLVTRSKDCEFVRLAGYTGAPQGVMHPSTIRRENQGAEISYPAGITVLSNWWTLAPVHGPRLMVYAYYDCAGRLVRQLFIDEEVRLE